MKELVSVVIPIYNVEEFLKECIESVINQSYKNIEIILVDDGSTDMCPRICDKYSLENKNVIAIHQKNAGLSAARNTGLKAAKGKYIYFLDSDDYIVADAIRMLVTQAEHYQSDIVFFDSSIIDEKGNTLADMRYVRKQSYASQTDSVFMMKQLLKYRDYFTCVPMLFIRRDSLCGLAFCEGIIYEDVLFTYKLFMSNQKAIHLPAQLYVRRIRDNSIMQKNIRENNIRSLFVIIDQILPDCGKDDKSEGQVEVAYLQLEILYQTLINRYSYLPQSSKRNCKKEYLIYLKKMENAGIRNHRIYERIKSIVFRYFNSKVINDIVSFGRKRKLRQKYTEYVENLNVNSSQNIFILGTPLHGNLGDHLIALAEIQLLKQEAPQYNIIDIPMPIYANCRRKFRKLVGKNDIIMISGGGWLGSLWMHNEVYVRNMVKDFGNNKVIIMPQTVFYEDNEKGKKELKKSKKIYSCHKNLYLFLRDEKSYNFAIKNLLIDNSARCKLLPDMALAYQRESTGREKRKNALICFRRDREKVLSDIDEQRIREYIWSKNVDTTDTTTVYLYEVSENERKDVVEGKIREYGSARLVVTDRLHSMIFAAISNTPCVALDNLTGKVFGVYNWIKSLKYIRVARDVSEVMSAIDELLNLDMLPEYKFQNDKEYKPLIEVILEKKNGKNKENVTG